MQPGISLRNSYGNNLNNSFNNSPTLTCEEAQGSPHPSSSSHISRTLCYTFYSKFFKSLCLNITFMETSEIDD